MTRDHRIDVRLDGADADALSAYARALGPRATVSDAIRHLISAHVGDGPAVCHRCAAMDDAIAAIVHIADAAQRRI
jgi:hypothetical protein